MDNKTIPLPPAPACSCGCVWCLPAPRAAPLAEPAGGRWTSGGGEQGCCAAAAAAAVVVVVVVAPAAAAWPGGCGGCQSRCLSASAPVPLSEIFLGVIRFGF